MKHFPILVLVAASLSLAGCVENTGSTTGSSGMSSSTSTLATRGNLSPEAIRLQTMTMQLTTLEERQRAADARVASFSTQGAILGAGGGALAGMLACQLRECSDVERRNIMLGGAVAGGVVGHQAGGAQARRQNNAAEAEAALLDRIRVADDQLTTARQARAQAERVAAQNNRTLNDLKARVVSGQANRSALETARADAAADARAIEQAKTALGGGVDSVKSEPRLVSQHNSLRGEQRATDASYNALLSSIKSSAL